MPRKKKQTRMEGYLTERVDRFDGLNTEHAVTISETELAKAENVQYTLQDKIKPRPGQSKRFTTDFDTSPVKGMGGYYKSDGTTRLVMAAGTSLYVDTPHVSFAYDSQTDWQKSGVYSNLDTVSSPGDVKMLEILSDGFEDGTFGRWTSADSGWTIDTTVYKTGTRSAKGTGTQQKLIYDFKQNRTSVYVKLACRFAETNQVHYPVIFISPSGSQIQAVVANSDGHFKYHNGSALTNFPVDTTYAANTWYTVEVWISNGTFWVSINGTSVTPSGLTVKDTANASQTQVAKFQAQNAGATAATMWIDDVYINPVAAVFSRSSVAYKSDGTQVAANVPRYEPGRFGQAVMVEEGTTNLLSAEDSSFEGGTVGNWVTVHANLSVVTSPSWHGGKALKVVPTAQNGRVQIRIDSGGLGLISQGDTITLSAYARLESGGPANISIAITINGVDYYTTTLSVTSTNWTRISVTKTIDQLGTGVYIQLFGGQLSGSQATVIFDGIQLEKKAYPTSWTLGGSTRSPETLTIPTAGVLNPQEGTVECWVYVDPNVHKVANNGWNMAFVVCDPISGEPNQLRFGYNRVRGKWHVKTSDSTGTFWYAEYTVASGWHHFALTWNKATTTAKMYVDGVVVASNTAAPLPSAFASVAYIGLWFNGGYQLNSLIDDLRISSRARTDEEIAAAYSSNAPLAWDVDTTYLLSFDGNLDLPADRQGVWVSPVQNASNAYDYSSLTVTWDETLQPNTTILCQVRTSTDGVNWSLWYNQVNGQFATAPARPYSQVRFILQEIGNATSPVLSKATVLYEGNPSATAVKTNFSVADKYSFSQLMDSLIVCNGVDMPVSYDGNTVTDVTAAPRVFLMTVFRNRLFGAKAGSNKSRLYFSDLLNVTSWPATNFIDVNPSDGDEIMCLIANASAFLILKQHQSYYLSGYSPYDFTISPAGEGGTISPWGAVWTPRGIFLLDREGIWATDFRKRVLITKPIQTIWDSLNQSALTKAALFYYKDKLLAAVPSKNASSNDTLLVYDMTQSRANRWSVWTGWNPACFLAFWERGSWKYLYGSSVTGNVYEIGGSNDDAGLNFTATVETGQMPYVSEDFIKRLKWCDVYFGNGSVNTSVQVSFIVDGVASSPVTFTVPSNRVLTVKRLFPPPWGKTVGLRIVWPSTGASGPTFLGYSMTYYPRAPRPERVW